MCCKRVAPVRYIYDNSTVIFMMLYVFLGGHVYINAWLGLFTSSKLVG